MAETTVPTNTTSEQPTRRALLGMTAAIGAGSALPAEALAGEQDLHVTWLSECFAARDRCNGYDDAPEDPADIAEFERLRDQIFGTPARTAAGVAAQMMLLVDMMTVGSIYEPATTVPMLKQAAAVLAVRGWQQRPEHGGEA